MALSLAMAGCLQTDPSGKGGDPSGNPDIRDRDLLAGATSSTNWPPDDAHVRVAVNGTADSALTLRFHWLTERPKLSGRLRIFRVGPIPALDSVPELSVPFEDAESLFIGSDRLMAFLGRDTGAPRFALRIETDSGNCHFFGFEYSPGQRRFLHSPLSILATSSAVMYPDSSYLTGVLEPNLRKSASGGNGIPGLYFYIPGSPFFWKAGPDSTIGLGPLPKGGYPVRILRISDSETAQGTNRLETFAAIFTPVGEDPDTRRPVFSVSAGEKLESVEYKGSILLRAP